MSKFPKVGQKFYAIGPIWTVTEINEENERIAMVGKGKEPDTFQAEIEINLEDFDFLIKMGFMIKFVSSEDFGEQFGVKVVD